MGIACVVWDGDRKGPRYTQRSRRLSSDTKTATTHEDILSPFYPFSPTFQATPNEADDERSSAPQAPRPSMRFVLSQAKRFISITRSSTFLLVQLLARQNILRSGLPRSVHAPDPLNDALKTINFDELRNCDVGLIAQHPHLGRIQDVISKHQQSPSLSSALLTAVMVHICCGKSDGLLHFIQRSASQVYMRAPRQIEAAQAMELLAVHLPFLLEEAEGRTLVNDANCPPPGASLIGMALNVASALEYDDERVKRTLWMSLSCWEIALKLHEQQYPTITSMQALELEDSSVEEEDSLYTLARIALYARYKALRTTMECIRALVYDLSVDDELVKRQQNEAIEHFTNSMERLSDERCIHASQVKQHELGEESASALQLSWLWLDLESMGFRQKVLGHVLSCIFTRANRENASKSMDISVSWTHPTWQDDVSKYGSRRNEEIGNLLAKAIRIGTRIAKRSVHAPVIPATLFCALVVAAAKTILDTQSVLLQNWAHLHRETEVFVMLIGKLADVLQFDIRMPIDGESGVEERGVAACSSMILRAIAETMHEWYERQALVLAKHRTSTSTRAASIDPGLDIPPIDSLFEGILEWPEWNITLDGVH